MVSSSTSSLEKSYKYDVFLSFRGEDTRKNFVDHLYSALQEHSINTYKDDERLQKGKRINDELLKSIEDSKFCIIVFSKNYASSSWCLDELAKIMECQKTTTANQIAYPVFYDVDPSQVRKQQGAVGEAFAKHNKLAEAGKWRDALEEAANLAGWDLRNTADGHEAKVIKIIVEQISLELRSIHLSDDENLIGMEARMKDLESSLEIGLNDVRMIGIKGIGGDGKTTLARTIFDRASIQFEGISFVENVREVSKASGLQSLQKQVLSDVLNEKDVTLRSVRDGYSMMKMRLRGKKVLVVLDDVDHIDQLEALAGKPNWFKPGSRIIITTRDEQVLVAHGVKWIHDANLLTDVEAICLFSRHAFGREIPVQGYEKLSLEVVRYAAGLPLTIRVLGSFLCSKRKLEWGDALERLKTIPLKETLEKLELSYIGLEDDYKEIFLDVACLLKGWLKDDAIRILECCGFHARNGLRVLEQKSLISISNKCLGMHDHIEEMGRNIVRRLHPDEPNRHSRLWIREEIEDILVNDLGTEATRAIEVDSWRELGPEIFTKGFGNMKKLRFLHVGENKRDYFFHDNPFYFKGKFDQATTYFPDGLRYLSWVYYPRRSLPKTFRGNNLVALEMRESRIVKLWGGGERKVLNKLRFLDLTCSKSLRTLDLGGTPNLERLDLRGCFDLVELQTPVGCLKRLVYLNLEGCVKLKSFSFIKQLESLKVLCLKDLNLKEFPDVIPGHCNNSLVMLQFGYNDIEELPSSIANLHKLVSLDLSDCYKLRSLRGSIFGLRHLRNLNLSGCPIKELPKEIGRLEFLENLGLERTYIKHLPKSICMLKHMKTLDLSLCVKLEKLPGDLGQLECLENLFLNGCRQLRDIPYNICKLKRLKYLNLFYCTKLEKLPEGLGLLECLEELIITSTGIRQLPRSISLLKGLKIDGSESVLLSLSPES